MVNKTQLKILKQKHTASARALLGQPFEDIISMCALQPGKTWKDWFDPYGNKLRIFKKKCKITKNKVEVTGIHDIYCKADFFSISRHSYWCCFSLCRDKDKFWFVGNDGILRYLIRSGGYWKTYPPMLSGYSVLKNISSWFSIEEPDVISIEDGGGDSSHIYTMYITPWPPEQEINELLKESNIHV